MKILGQIGILSAVCLAGEGLSRICPFPLPASVIAMFLLFALLALGWLKLGKISETVGFLQQNMGFFFLPAGVGILEQYPAVKARLLPLLFICTVSTLLTFAVTAYTVTGVIRLQKRFGKAGSHE